MRNLVLSVALLIPAAVCADPVLDPNQPYQAKTSNEVNYTIDYRVIITAPEKTRLLRVWVPVPPSDVGQTVEKGEWSVFPSNVKPTFHTENLFGNRFAYFEFNTPRGAQIVTHRFKASVRQLNWNLDSSKVMAARKWPASFEPYRRAESNIVIDSRFKLLAFEITRGKKDPASELDSVMSWVQDNLTYDHSNTSLVASAEHALLHKRGDCSDYHGLCSSLGRGLGVPTRVVYGIHLFPKNYPGHCKLEAYLPPYGWVSFDVSETQKLIKSIAADKTLDADTRAKWIKAANQRMCSGFRDNTWLLCTKGTEYDLAPPAGRKVPLVSSIYAEADGKPLPTPDAANPNQREFAWMTAHEYKSDKPVKYPFSNWHALEK